MGTILIRCPQTKSYVFTGVTMEHEAFFQHDLGDYELICPDCGETHRWTHSTAWIKDWPDQQTG